MNRFLGKMKGGGELPSKLHNKYILHASIGVFVSVILIGYWTGYMNVPFLMAPLGTSAVIVFGAPMATLAQPRNLIGSYLIAAAVGLVCFHLLGADLWVLALSGALLLALMQLTRTMHPPAMAILLVMLNYSNTVPSWSLFITIFISSLILLLLALLINNIGDNHNYPHYWLGKHK